MGRDRNVRGQGKLAEPEKEVCRKCGSSGCKTDEFLSPHTGLCASCSTVTPERTGVSSTTAEMTTTIPPVQTDFPGREEEQQGDSDKEQQKDEQKEQAPGSVTTASTNRIERALIHLDFLEQEIKGLMAHGSELLGPMRRAALTVKEQFDGPVHKWPPLAKIRAVLLAVKTQQ